MKNHLSVVYQKLHLRNRLELAVYVVRKGFDWRQYVGKSTELNLPFKLSRLYTGALRPSIFRRSPRSPRSLLPLAPHAFLRQPEKSHHAYPLNVRRDIDDTPGNSAGPPPTVSPYMAVIASSHITKTGSTISRNVTEIVIVYTQPGYGPNPGLAGTGTVVHTLCKN